MKKKRENARILTTREAAEHLGIISEKTLRHWRCSRERKGPPWISIEGRIGYRREDLDAYLLSCQRMPGDEGAA